MDITLVVLPVIGTVPAWRKAARSLLARGVSEAVWQVGMQHLIFSRPKGPSLRETLLR